MLVLTRKPNERIVIGDDIVITLVHTDSGKARIGIEAPKCVPINREELLREELKRRREEKQRTAQRAG